MLNWDDYDEDLEQPAATHSPSRRRPLDKAPAAKAQPAAQPAEPTPAAVTQASPPQLASAEAQAKAASPDAAPPVDSVVIDVDGKEQAKVASPDAAPPSDVSKTVGQASVAYLANHRTPPAGYERVTVDQKAMINCRADLNQLVPFKYDWAWQKYLNGCANHWMPQEINMAEDIKLWRTPEGLSEDERLIVKRSLGFFSTADSLVANNLVLAIYRLITNPECRQYLLRQAFEEAIHTHAYQYCIESLGMDEGEIFNMYHEVPSVARKASWALQYTKEIADPTFATGTPETDQALLKNLIAYYCVLEGIFFYCGFTQILSMGRRNKMTGTSEQFQYILRDESMHVNLRHRRHQPDQAGKTPSYGTNPCRNWPRNMILEGTQLEIDYAKDTMPRGVLDMNANMMADYLRFIANRRLAQINLGAFFPQPPKIPSPG